MCGWLLLWRPTGYGGGLVVDRIVDAATPPFFVLLCWGGVILLSLAAPAAAVVVAVVGRGFVCVGLLVPVGLSNPYGSSTSGLSTQWSAGGLPHPKGCVDTLS